MCRQSAKESMSHIFTSAVYLRFMQDYASRVSFLG
jgi:hypothetical protein